MDLIQQIGDWVLNMHHDEEDWGGTGEIVFWIFVLLAHVGLIAYAAWRLAEKHTEATGCSVVVPVKVDAALPTMSSGGEVEFSSTLTNRGKGKRNALFGLVSR